MVRKQDVYDSLSSIGVKSPGILLVHSSLKSFGQVEGGAQTVVDALTSVLQPRGTLVMPALSQSDWLNVYKTWHIDKPSEVGIITETFRKNPGVLRSDQATHSVCARGKYASYITEGHTDFGPRCGPFGDYAFSHSSPWQKMYDLKADVLFLGVTMYVNTFKHFIEYRIVERALAGVGDGKQRDILKDRLWRYSDSGKKGIWPFHNAVRLQEVLDEAGLVKKQSCGSCEMLLVNVKQMVDFAEELLEREPQNWYGDDVIEWLSDAALCT